MASALEGGIHIYEHNFLTSPLGLTLYISLYHTTHQAWP